MSDWWHETDADERQRITEGFHALLDRLERATTADLEAGRGRHRAIMQKHAGGALARDDRPMCVRLKLPRCMTRPCLATSCPNYSEAEDRSPASHET